MEDHPHRWKAKMALYRSTQSQPDLINKYGRFKTSPVSDKQELIRRLRPHTAEVTQYREDMLHLRREKTKARPRTAAMMGGAATNRPTSYSNSTTSPMTTNGSTKYSNNTTSPMSTVYGLSTAGNNGKLLGDRLRKDCATPVTNQSSGAQRCSMSKQRPQSAQACMQSSDVLASRGTRYTELGGKVDILKKVRAQSCRRRSARLDSEQKRRIVSAHRQTAEERVQSYYRLLEERRALELDLVARRATAIKRFSTAIWKVLWIIRWKRVMIAISLDNMVMTAMEMDWHTRNTDSPASQFKREDFSRSKVADRVPAWAERILRKPPEWRSTSECNRLHALMRPLKSFEKFTERIQTAMCRALRYEFVNAKRVILRKGQPGVCFYFIYSGSTFVNVEDTNSNKELFVKTAAILHRGESFGELALLRDGTRSATITCREDCELLTVDNEVFAKACPAIFEQEMEEKFNFIRKLPIFMANLWCKESLQSICFEGQIKQYKNNQVIAADNFGDDWMYICMEGKCKVVRSLILESKKEGQQKLIESIDSEEDDKITNLFSNITNEGSLGDSKRKSSTASRSSKESRANSLQSASGSKAGSNKVQMLNSMAMEWFRVHEQVEEIKRKNREGSMEDNNQISGMQTFSSLMRHASEKAEEKGDEAVFVEVAEVHPQDIFNIQSILWGDSQDNPKSPLILVSSGAKILRLKRAELFRSASFEALEYIKTITACEKYPSESEMLERYRIVHGWTKYKQSTLNDKMLDRDSPSDKERKARMDVMHSERYARDAKLLQALKRNETLEKNSHREAESAQQRVTFLFELEKEAKVEDDELKGGSTTEKSESLQQRRTRRVSAEGVLPNLIEHMVLDTSSKAQLTSNSRPVINSRE